MESFCEEVTHSGFTSQTLQKLQKDSKIPGLQKLLKLQKHSKTPRFHKDSKTPGLLKLQKDSRSPEAAQERLKNLWSSDLLWTLESRTASEPLLMREFDIYRNFQLTFIREKQDDKCTDRQAEGAVMSLPGFQFFALRHNFPAKVKIKNMMSVVNTDDADWLTGWQRVVRSAGGAGSTGVASK